VIYRTTACLCC